MIRQSVQACSGECSNVKCPFFEHRWEHVRAATMGEGQADERRSRTPDGGAENMRASVRPNAMASQQTTRDAPADIGVGGQQQEQDAKEAAGGGQAKKTIEAAVGKRKQAVEENESLQSSQGQCIFTLALSTLCPSENESLADAEDESESDRQRMCASLSQSSQDVFSSFWSRRAPVSALAMTADSQAADRRAVSEARRNLHEPDVNGAFRVGPCVGFCRLQGGVSSGGAASEQDAETGKDGGCCCCGSGRQQRLAHVRMSEFVLDLRMKRPRLAPYVCFAAGSSSSARGQALPLGSGREEAMCDGLGFWGMGQGSVGPGGRQEWARHVLRENELVMETLLVGQRVLQIVAADRGRCSLPSSAPVHFSRMFTLWLSAHRARAFSLMCTTGRKASWDVAALVFRRAYQANDEEGTEEKEEEDGKEGRFPVERVNVEGQGGVPKPGGSFARQRALSQGCEGGSQRRRLLEAAERHVIVQRIRFELRSVSRLPWECMHAFVRVRTHTCARTNSRRLFVPVNCHACLHETEHCVCLGGEGACMRQIGVWGGYQQ